MSIGYAMKLYSYNAPLDSILGNETAIDPSHDSLWQCLWACEQRWYLTLLYIASHKRDTGKQCTLGGIWAATWQNQQSDCVPSEDSDQPGYPPSLIRVFAVHVKKAWVVSYPLSAQRRLWSDWADAQAVLSLRWAHSHLLVLSCRGLINPVVPSVS